MPQRHFVRGRDDKKRAAAHAAARTANLRRNVRMASHHAPEALIAYLRTTYDDDFIAQKRALVAEGKAASHVILARPDTAADPGANIIACAFTVTTREDMRVEAEKNPKAAEVAAQLAQPPPDGSVWLMVQILDVVILLWQETVEHSAKGR